MHKQWNIISRDFPGLERNPGIKIPVKMTLDPGTEPLVASTDARYASKGLHSKYSQKKS